MRFNRVVPITVIALVLLGPMLADGECIQDVGQWRYGPSSAVAVANGYVYYGSGAMLVVADFAEPSAPLVVGDVSLPGLVRGIAVVGDRAFVAAGSAGLRVVDVSVPSDPLEIGSLSAARAVIDIEVDGNRAYLVDDGRLRILDVSNPSAPYELGTYPDFWMPDREVKGVAVSGQYAYLTTFDGDYSGGLIALDVVDPSSPMPTGSSVGWFGIARRVVVSEGYAYVALGRHHVDSESGIRVVDIGNPFSLEEVGGASLGWTVFDVALSGRYAYATAILDMWGDDNGLAVFDIGDPASVVSIGLLHIPAVSPAIAASEGHVYIAASHAGVRAIDVEDPVSPAEIGLIDTPGRMSGVALAGDFAYLADLDDGLRILDVSLPTSPVEVGSIAMADGARGVAIADGHAFVAAGYSGLRIIDVSDPEKPFEVGSFDTDSSVQGVIVEGSLAYLAAGGRGLWVIDVSIPADPVRVASISTPNNAVNVAVVEGYAYVADGFSGLRIIDVRTIPIQNVGAFGIAGGADSVALSGHHAYVAGHLDHTLRIIDVSTPSSPVEVGSFTTTFQSIHDVAVSDELAVSLEGYREDPDTGVLRVIDIRNPTSPVELMQRGGTFGTGGGVAMSGDQLVVAEGPAGVEILDISSCLPRPPAPRRSTRRLIP